MPHPYDELENTDALTSDERYISTEDEPLKYFKGCLFIKTGIKFLIDNYIAYDERGSFFDEKRDLLYIHRYLPLGTERGELIDEDTNLYGYYITIDEFSAEETLNQARNSVLLFKKKSLNNGHDQDEKLYKRILIDCMILQKNVDSRLELRFKEQFSSAILFILKSAYQHFNEYFPGTTEFRRVTKYLKIRTDSNKTGFCLKDPPRMFPLSEFFERMINHGYIKSTSREPFAQFFKGEIPKSKINWLGELHELKFFIDCLCSDRVLKKVPKQQWKVLNELFVYQGDKLPANWHRNCNKLKDTKKRALIQSFTEMLHSQRL